MNTYCMKLEHKNENKTDFSEVLFAFVLKDKAADTQLFSLALK